MLLLVIETFLLMVGVWVLSTGEIPDRLFKLLFRTSSYLVPSMKARLFGLLLASPIPLTFLILFLLGAVGIDSSQFSPFLEIGILIVILAVAVLYSRDLNTPSSD